MITLTSSYLYSLMLRQVILLSVIIWSGGYCITISLFISMNYLLCVHVRICYVFKCVRAVVFVFVCVWCSNSLGLNSGSLLKWFLSEWQKWWFSIFCKFNQFFVPESSNSTLCHFLANIFVFVVDSIFLKLQMFLKPF